MIMTKKKTGTEQMMIMKLDVPKKKKKTFENCHQFFKKNEMDND